MSCTSPSILPTTDIQVFSYSLQSSLLQLPLSPLPLHQTSDQMFDSSSSTFFVNLSLTLCCARYDRVPSMGFRRLKVGNYLILQLRHFPENCLRVKVSKSVTLSINIHPVRRNWQVTLCTLFKPKYSSTVKIWAWFSEQPSDEALSSTCLIY